MVGHRNPDGSANLSGINLPVDRVAAASARIDALAKAAKRAGSSRPIDHLRAELFLGMTDGTYTGLDDATILALLLATGDDTGSPADIADGDGPTDSDTTDSDTDLPGTGPDSDSAAGGTDPAAERAEDDPDTTAGVSGRARGGLELRVRVSTLLGCDQYPGEIAGWGPVHAELARDLIPTLLRG